MSLNSNTKGVTNDTGTYNSGAPLFIVGLIVWFMLPNL